MVQHPQRLSESRTGCVLCVSCSQSNIMLVCSLSLSRDSFSVHGRGRYKALPLPVFCILLLHVMPFGQISVNYILEVSVI